MPATGTANLDRNRAFVAATGTGPNGETTVAIPAFISVDINGDPVSGGGGGGGGGDASAANQVTGNASLASIDTKTSTVIGHVDGIETLLSAEAVLVGAVTEAAPASDTASSGVNGRLQRIAQRLTTMLTGIVLAAGTAIIGKVGIDQTTPGTTNKVHLGDLSAGEYEFVAASATNEPLGTGATGDFLAGLLIIPLTAAAGAVSIKDGSGTARTIFAGGGTTALPTLAPINVGLGIYSTSGAWQVTTGANVQVFGIGNFT